MAISQAERDAGRWARKLHGASNGLTPLQALRETVGNTTGVTKSVAKSRFNAAKSFAAENGFVFWQYDWSAGRYYWTWELAQDGAGQNIKAIRTRIRRQAMRMRSAIQAGKVKVPAPGVPFRATGGLLGEFYKALVAMATVQFYLAAGSERVAVPIASLEQMVQEEMYRAIYPQG